LIILLSVFQVFATILSTLVVDKLGRKVLILRGQAFIAICLISITLFEEVFNELIGASATSIIVIIIIFVHLLGMNLTLGPCCIIYCTEIVEDITWMIITLKGLSLSIALTSEYMI
jgi:hypothetical protein